MNAFASVKCVVSFSPCASGITSAIGVAAPLLLATFRFVQGLGVGGEWGGAALLAVENAPKGWENRFGAAPQLGAPLGFLFSNGLFLLLGLSLLPTGWAVVAESALVGRERLPFDGAGFDAWLVDTAMPRQALKVQARHAGAQQLPNERGFARPGQPLQDEKAPGTQTL